MDEAEYGIRRYRVIKSFGTILSCLKLGNSVEAEETLQETHKHLQELTPNDFSCPSLEEIKEVNHAEQIIIKDAAWNPRNGTILLAQKSSQDNFFVRSLNAFGALAIRMYHLDISVNALEQSIKHIDDADDEELNASRAVAYNNLGCAYICNGLFQNAKESLSTALKTFIILKNATNGNVVEENIITVSNNLRLVHQAQRNYIADLQVRGKIFASLRQVTLPPRIIAVVEYNDACASLENRKLRKALNEFEKLKSFCETELNQAEELLKCISLKICLVNLMLGNSSKASVIIDTETSTLPELIGVLDVKANFPLDFSVTIAETLVDICVNQGNADLACNFLAYLVSVCLERCGSNHPTFASILLKQGIVFSHMGKTVQSRQCLTDALEIFTRAFGYVNPEVLKCNSSLARLESREGFQEKSLLHSQRVLENVQEICQVSFVDQLKETFMGKFDRSRLSIPETGQEEHLKLESLISEFGVEIASILSQQQASDLGNSTVSPPEIQHCPTFPTSCFPEEMCAKLSFNFLKAGLWLFNLGMVAQSTVFLLLSCTYINMFHNYLECSDSILVQVIFVVCYVKAMKNQRFLKEERLRNEFKVLREYIEGRVKQRDQPERRALFFEEKVNLKVSLALFLRSFVEMEMFEMIDVIHGLFSKLQNHHLQEMTHITLVEELRFALFGSNIECLGRIAKHDVIFSTPLGTIYKNQLLKDQKSFHKDQIYEEREPGKMYRALALKRDGTPCERFCRFVVDCPISYEVDIATLKQVNACSMRSVQDTLPQLILRNQNQVVATQYFIELEPLISLESDISILLGDFSLLPLILSAADKDAESGTQPLVFITTEKTCQGIVEFSFPDRATSQFIFGQLLKNVLTNLERLAEITDMRILDDHLVLKIKRPSTGQILMWCVEDSIKIKTQLIHSTQSREKREFCHEEMLPCSCPVIKMFFAEELERCAGSFGILFEERIEKAWCIASLRPGNQNEMVPAGNKTLTLDGKEEQSHPASSLRMESQSKTPCLTLPHEENMLSESCTQTDSLSIPLTFELGTQTDESNSSDQVINSTGSLVTDASDTTNVRSPSRQMTSETRQADILERYVFTAEETTAEDNNSNTDPEHDRFGKVAEAKTLLGESLLGKSSSGEELNWAPYVPRKQRDSKVKKHEKEGSEDKKMAHLAVSEIKRNSAERHKSLQRRSTGNDCQPPFVIPLTTTAEQRQPCVELHTSEHLVRSSPPGDWQGNVVDDVTDSTVNHEMVIMGKNEPRLDVTRHRDLAKAAGQDHPPFYSLSTTAKSPFQGENVVADDSPRPPDHAANRIVGANSCNSVNEIQRNTKTSFVSATSLRAAHDNICSDEGPFQNHNTGAGRCGGLKGGRKDQSIPNCSSSDTLKIVSSPEWSCNGAKSKKKVQRVSDVPLGTKRVDKDILSKRVEVADYVGIRPGFLARHTDDNSISMTSDMWNVENTEGRPLDILSSYERFGCHPDRSFHSQSPCSPPLVLSAGPDCSAESQGLPPIGGTTPVLPGSLTYLSSNEQLSQIHNPCNLPPPPALPSLPYDGREYYHQLLNDDLTNGAVQSRSPHVVSTADDILFAQGPSSASQGEATTSLVNAGLGLPYNVINQTGIGHSAFSVNPTLTTQNVITSQTETSSTSERSTRKHQESERIDREPSTATMLANAESTSMQPGLLNSNSHVSDDDSLAALERRVAEACSLVERVLKEREEKEKARKERERRQREERAGRELQERERREREARETRQTNESGQGTSAGMEEEGPSQRADLPESPRWLCEHYQRLCRVKFPCCGRFYPCHRCHNNSDECENDNCKAKEAFYIECSVCKHQQAINRDAHTCARCKTKMSAYFCSICKHFTGEDKHPYHCTKCGICRIHQDRSFHCDVCNVCLDKRLQGKHKCRPDSGHDECCICLEDAFSGCQILPCSHKVHRECAIAMIQNGVRSCPICRYPLYSQSGGTE